jgi:DNA-binding HxlR family transcriptional regulator
MVAKLRLATKSGARDEKRPADKRKNRPRRELPAFDRLVHERIRLGIVSALAINDSLSFNDLKRVLNTTDGNLSVHARKLEEAAYVRCKKFFDGRIPRSEYRLTALGRKAFTEYLRQMEKFIAVTREQQG